MNKTSHEVTADLYALVRVSLLAGMVNGGLYHDGCRPRDSHAEDIVIVYLAGQPGEIQSCLVNLQVFVPDLDPWQNGVLVCDHERTMRIEREAAQMVEDLTAAVTNYRIRLNDTIHTIDAPDLGQHIVIVPLRMDYWTDGYVDTIDTDVEAFRTSQLRQFKVQATS